MQDSITFQILVHMAEAVRLEQQEFNRLDSIYRAEFDRDFRDELLFLADGGKLPRPGPGSSPEDPDLPPMEVPKSTMKKMHRKLAMITHPDRAEVEDDEEFKKIQTAYEEDDAAALIAECASREIDITLTKSESEMLRDRIEAQRKILAHGRSTAHWIWCESDKAESTRAEIWKVMGVNPDKFEKWLGDMGIVVIKELEEDEILVSYSVE